MFFSKLLKRNEKEYIYDTCEDCENECEKWLGKRPPLVTVQQETPPPTRGIHVCCPECCRGR